MEELDEGLYKAITVALVVGIIFSVAFNLYMRHRIMSGEGFTELYFMDHEDLPEVIEVDEAVNVSFTFRNHEGSKKMYVVEVDSPAGKARQTVPLEDEGSLTLTLNITPRNETWMVSSRIDRKEQTKRGVDGSGFEVIPLEVEGFGEILQVNTSIEELKREPFTYSYREESYVDYKRVEGSENKSFTIQVLDENQSSQRYRVIGYTYGEEIKESQRYLFGPQKKILNKTEDQVVDDSRIPGRERGGFDRKKVNNTHRIYVEQQELIHSQTTYMREYKIVQKPFIIKVYEEDEKTGEELEIHFWAKVV